ncbi:type VI secretion protein [Vibrio lentus]|nr:type VI secretion protein [Vibrio lentus]
MTLAARLTDMHVCPMQTPAVPPIPHVGGAISGPGVPTVLVASLPKRDAWGHVRLLSGLQIASSKAVPPALIMSKPAARMGDTTNHGALRLFLVCQP